MKIAIVQPTTVESALRNTEKSLESGSQVVLLPEKWVKTLDDLPLAEFQRLAVKYTAFIVPGAVEDEVSVISPIITPSGEIAGIAKKIHLHVHLWHSLYCKSLSLPYNIVKTSFEKSVQH